MLGIFILNKKPAVREETAGGNMCPGLNFIRALIREPVIQKLFQKLKAIITTG